jgi:hypothetical protein
MLEKSFSNNKCSLPLKVLKKGNLRAIGIGMKKQTNEEIQNKEAILQATFINDGEVPLHKVYVVFFSQKEQTQENEIGRVLIDEINPKTPITAEIKWKYEPGISYQPSFQLFLKGSLQRVSSVEGGIEK